MIILSNLETNGFLANTNTLPEPYVLVALEQADHCKTQYLVARVEGCPGGRRIEIPALPGLLGSYRLSLFPQQSATNLDPTQSDRQLLTDWPVEVRAATSACPEPGETP